MSLTNWILRSYRNTFLIFKVNCCVLSLTSNNPIKIRLFTLLFCEFYLWRWNYTSFLFRFNFFISFFRFPFSDYESWGCSLKLSKNDLSVLVNSLKCQTQFSSQSIRLDIQFKHKAIFRFWRNYYEILNFSDIIV